MSFTFHRRGFLTGGLGAAAGTIWTRTLWGQEGSAEKRLRELGIELPPPPRPIATYVPAVLVGNMLYVAGHGPADGEGVRPGKVGAGLTLDEGRIAARATALNVLSTMREALGSLDRVLRLVRTLGMVNAAADFTEHPQVVNGFSDLMVEIFGERAGKGSRCAVGMASLPSDIAVEVESFWEVRP